MYYTYMERKQLSDGTEIYCKIYKVPGFTYKSVSILSLYKDTRGGIIGVDIQDEVTGEVLIGVPYKHFLTVMCDKHTYFYNFEIKHGELHIKYVRRRKYPSLIVQMHPIHELLSKYRMYSYDNVLTLYPVVYGVADCEPLYGAVIAQHKVGTDDTFYGEQYVRVVSKGVTCIENVQIVFNDSSHENNSIL